MNPSFTRKAVCVALASCFSAGSQALPVAPVVANGSAAFAQSGNTLTVTNSPGAIINWQGFSIAASEATRFIQQSANSAVLNRVTGADPSVILGQLQSNGRVFLINPNGITFGAGAQIDVAGLVASSLNMQNADFIAGRYRFSGSSDAGQVINRAQIRTPEGGQVFLIAPRVENSGLITTPQGDIVLAAGKKVEITDTRNPRVRIEIEAPEGEALNIGKLMASGGSAGLYGRSVKAGGQISANAAVVENGRVVFRRADTATATAESKAGTVTLEASRSVEVLPGASITADGPQAGTISVKAGEDVTLRMDAMISATGEQGGNIDFQAVAGTLTTQATVEAKGEDGPGGRITMLGQRVGLLARSRTDASGELGGGVVLVGGDFQGKNPDVQNAARTFVDSDAEVRADAAAAGDGGRVIVWGDEVTRYNGSISARAAGTGAGGFVEVSGKDSLEYHGRVDVSSPLGAGGTLLLDPTNITIQAAAGTLDPELNGTADPSLLFADGGANTTLGVAELTAGFAAGNTILLQASNNITFGVATTLQNGVNLTATANNILAVNAALSAAGGNINLTGGSVTGTAAGNITTTGAANTNANGGNVTINATSGVINLAGTITANGGTVASGNPGRSGGTVTLTGAGVTVSGAINAQGSAGLGTSQAGGAGGTVSITSTAGISTNAINVTAGNASATSAAGGAGGTITLTNSTAGNITAGGALTARNGSSTGLIASGSAGSVSLTNSFVGGTISTGAITTSGQNNGAGGSITVDGKGSVTLGGAVASSGGTANANTSGRNAGDITIAGNGVTASSTIAASGSNAPTATSSRAGGNGGAIQITSTNGINTSAGAITASGGNAATSNAVGGNAGTIAITNNTAGTLTTGALLAQVGASTGTTTGATAGYVRVTNNAATTLQTGAITTTGLANGTGGEVTLNGAGAITITSITASGGAGTATAGAHGGNAGVVTVTSTGGNITSGAITASGGNGTTAASNGGNAGTVTLDAAGGTPTVTLSGNVTAVGGNRAGGGTDGAGAKVWVKDALLLNAATVTVDTRGGTAGAGAGGDIQFDGTVNSTGGARALVLNAGKADVLVAGATGALSALSALTITGNDVTLANIGAGAAGVTGATAVTAVTNGADTGEIRFTGTTYNANAQTYVAAAGATLLVNAGATTTFTSTADAVRFGNAANANGGQLSLADGSNLVVNTANGTLDLFAGIQADSAETVVLNAGTSTISVGQIGSGAQVGAVTLTGATTTLRGDITTADVSGNNVQINGAVTLPGNVTITTDGATNDGRIGITGAINADAAANRRTLTLAAGTGTIDNGSGAAMGAIGGTQALGAVTATGGTIRLGALTTTGGANQDGGAVSVTGSGAVTVGAVTTNGGTPNVSTVGRNAGAVTISGAGVTTTGAITASGSNAPTTGSNLAGGNGAAIQITSSNGINTGAGTITASGGNAATTNAAGGNAGTITLTNNTAGTLTTGALTAQSGAATGTGGGGTAGSVTVTNNAATQLQVGAINTSGGAKGAGGSVSLASTGALNVTGAVNTSGGTPLGTMAGAQAGSITLAGSSVVVGSTLSANGGAGLGTNQNGGAAGAITVDATGTGQTITLAGNVSAVGGNRTGTGTAGAGAKLWMKDAVLLNAATVTLDARGGSAGVGTGGVVQFDGAIDSTGGARALVVNTNAATQFNGAVGASSPLLSLVTDAAGGTQVAGGAVNTSGAAGQTYGDALSVSAATTLTATSGTAAFSSTVAAGANSLTIAATEINFTGNVTGTGQLALRPSTTLASMTLGAGADSGAAVLDITTAELGLIQAGFAGVTFGRSDSSAGVTVNNLQLRAATTIQTGSGSIAGAGNVTGDVAGRALTLAANTTGGSINLSGALGTVGTRLGAVSANAAGNVTLGAINANGTVLAASGANLTLNGALNTTDTTASAIVASAVGDFDNNVGAGALTTGGGGRWLVYTSTPVSAANFNGLNSANLPVWNRTYAANAPASVNQSGNRYLFATAPTLAVTSTSATKTYGDDLTGTLSSMYSVSLAGVNANTYGGVILADSAATLASLVGGAAAVSSNGAASTAAVSGSPYAVNVSAGTLSGLTGYGFTYSSPGTITVNPAALTVSANNLSKVYGDADPTLTYSVTGLKNGELAASVFSNTLVRAAGETVPGGPYAITRGTLAANGNYTINTFNPAALSITPAALRVVADDKSRLVGDPNPPFTSRVTGFRFSDTLASLSGNLSLESSAGVASPSANYAIVPSGVSSPNYAVTFVNGELRVGNSVTRRTLIDPLQGALTTLTAVNSGDSSGTTSVIVPPTLDINRLPATAAGPDDEGAQDQVIGDEQDDRRRDCFAASPMAAMSCRR